MTAKGERNWVEVGMDGHPHMGPAGRTWGSTIDHEVGDDMTVVVSTVAKAGGTSQTEGNHQCGQVEH